MREAEGGGGLKHQVAEFLENHWVESFIVLLVFADIFLVTVEAGIDGQLLCVNGKEVPFGSPAGEHLVHGGHHGGSLLSVDSLGLASSSVAVGATSRLALDLLANTALGLPSLELFFLGKSGLAGKAMEPIQAEPDFDGPVPRGIVRGQRPNSHYEQQSGTSGSREAAAGEAEVHSHSAEIHEHDPHAAPVHEGVEEGHTEHAAGGGGGHGDQPNVLVCETAEGHNAHHILHNCHTWSIIILLIFAVEIILKIWSVPNWLKSFLHKLDCTVVFLSLAVDTIVMWYIEEERQRMVASGDAEGAAKQSHEQREQAEFIQGLLIASRIWRVVRIFHGLFESHLKSQELGSSEHHGSPTRHSDYA